MADRYRFRLEHREAGRKRWRVTWRQPAGTGYYYSFDKCFRTRAKAEAYLAAQEIKQSRNEWKVFR